MSCPGRSLLPGKTRYPLYRRLGGPKRRSGQVRKISSPTRIRTPDRPARSQSLNWLRYPAQYFVRNLNENCRDKKSSKVGLNRIPKIQLCMTSCFFKIHFKVVMSSKPKGPLPLSAGLPYTQILLTAKEIAFVFKCISSWQYRALNMTTVWPVLDWTITVPLFWIRPESFNCSLRLSLCDWSMYCFVAMWCQSDETDVVPFVKIP